MIELLFACRPSAGALGSLTWPGAVPLNIWGPTLLGCLWRQCGLDAAIRSEKFIAASPTATNLSHPHISTVNIEYLLAYSLLYNTLHVTFIYFLLSNVQRLRFDWKERSDWGQAEVRSAQMFEILRVAMHQQLGFHLFVTVVFLASVAFYIILHNSKDIIHISGRSAQAVIRVHRASTQMRSWIHD